ncbi:MAG: type IX secretion system sortase PorU [Haliscomenobacter sp.]|nr:type IX secretion system sortase PorU [Haliscomenobacter sp.]
MKNFNLTLLLLFLFRLASANSPFILADSLIWDKAPRLIPAEGETQQLWLFQGAVLDEASPFQPLAIETFPAPGPGVLNVRIIALDQESFPKKIAPGDDVLGETLQFQTAVEQERGQYWGKVQFVPILRRGNAFQRITRYRLEAEWVSQPKIASRSAEFADASLLRDGTLYKIAVQQEGMHKITYEFLKNELKVDIDRIDPRQIKLLGNRGGMLPELLSEPKPDDLQEIPVFLSGEADGKFDGGDFLLFYAEGPDRWTYNAATRRFTQSRNVYAPQQFYFLKISSGQGKRIEEQNALSATAYTSSSFDDYARLEDDKVNLQHEWPKSRGSGKRWFGDHMKNVREYKYGNYFKFPNLIPESPVYVKSEMAVRALQNSRFTLLLNGTALTSSLADRVVELEGEFDNIRDYAKNALLDGTVNLTSDNVEAVIRYPNPGGANDGSEGWVDYIELQVRRKLIFSGDQMAFRDIQTTTYSSSTFEVSGAGSDVVVWEITDPLTPRLQKTERSGSLLRFGVATETLRQFIAFSPSRPLLAPKAVGKTDNQNLHGLTRADMILLYPSELKDEAALLAEHRRKESGLTVEMVDIGQVYHEFSSGKKDPSAIRNFARMLFLRDPAFRYLLLFGDGSFDPKDVYGYGNDFIPTFQNESFNPLFAFPTDDYYALLDLPSTTDPLSGRLQIAVGRLTVNTREEAAQVVQKIIHYDTSPATFSDWRNRALFVGDDEDGMQHTQDADLIATDLQGRFPAINIDKTYLDAYAQTSTTGGNRIPAVTESINEAIFKGALIVTYLGHGGPFGWAQERILNIPDIVNWKNYDQQALFLTATCSFTNYDDPTFTSAGEEAFLNAKGGAMALMTTVRAVFANQNAALTQKSLEFLFKKQNGVYPTLGEAMQLAKNSSSSIGITTNSRKFTLIGDPAMRLAIPEYRVATTAINGKPLAAGQNDTLRALQQVTIEGVLTDLNGNLLEDFNGVLYPSVFDKAIQTKTLGQDAGSYPYPYTLQKNVLFRGRSSIQKGRFSFTFVAPKDINYAFGAGKLSYYAADNTRLIDASGEYAGVVIGGNATAQINDNQGPRVEVYMNNTDFISGGTTEADPLLLVVLTDDNGINVAGNSIGHDLEATLDENTQNTLVLNDFFSAALDDYRKGEVRYPLKDIPEGVHRIQVKAWDIANNPAEGYTEFVVAGDAGIALQHVLNYPNPFTSHTCFQFDHNYANQEIEVLIRIYSVSGRLVKTIEQTLFSDGALRRDDCIAWDGRDDYGDTLARGVYLYKVQIRATLPGSQQIQGESKFEKLVLLK